MTGATAVDRLSNLLVPTTSEILWGIVSGEMCIRDRNAIHYTYT